MSEVEKILTEIKEALLLEIRELRQEVEKLKKDDALANHVKATSNYLNTELNRQIMEIKGLDKEE